MPRSLPLPRLLPLLCAAALLPACQKPAAPAPSTAPSTAAPSGAPDDTSKLAVPPPTDTSQAGAVPGALPEVPGATGPSAAAAPADGAARSGDRGVSYVVPAGWAEERPRAPLLLRVLRPEEGSRTTIIVAETPAVVRSLDEVKIGMLAELSRMQELAAMEVVEQATAPIAGREAYRLHLRGKVGPHDVEMIAVNWRLPSGHPLQVTLTVPTEERSMASVRPVFDAFAASFAFPAR